MNIFNKSNSGNMVNFQNQSMNRRLGRNLEARSKVFSTLKSHFHLREIWLRLFHFAAYNCAEKESKTSISTTDSNSKWDYHSLLRGGLKFETSKEGDTNHFTLSLSQGFSIIKGGRGEWDSVSTGGNESKWGLSCLQHRSGPSLCEVFLLE